MKVDLLVCTPYALEVLLFSKQTRLTMDPSGLETIKAWPHEKKLKELEYMRGTIQSSWEFVDYTLTIQGVTRAFTHQFVRHRHMSFAQQSQRTVDMSGFDTLMPEKVQENGVASVLWNKAVETINDTYIELIHEEILPEDARGLLPTNVMTNIMVKGSLRAWHDAMGKRLCWRTQGEAREVFSEVRRVICEQHSWAEKFLRVHCATYGVCAFPNHDGCPVKPRVFNPNSGLAYDGSHPAAPEGIQYLWQKTC